MIRAYLDNNATTRPAPEVVSAMRAQLETGYMNPSSAAARVLQADADPAPPARRAVGALLGSPDLADGVVFTSGASEASSWALSAGTSGDAPAHMVVSRIEHPSVRRAAEAAGRRGVDVTFVGVDRHGVVDAAAFREALRPGTRLVSVMLANNETGVVQPVAELADHVREVCPGALVHCDATCAVGRIPIDLDGELAEVDLLSLSAHKFHGPKGVGALFVRPDVMLEPLIHGEQEDGVRGGTSNTPGVAGMAAAARLARERMRLQAGVADLRDRLERGLLAIAPGARVNGAGAKRLPNTTSVVLPGLDAADAVDRLAAAGICVATGSACSSGATSPSPVLLAMGLSYPEALSTLRFSLSVETTRGEVDLALDALRPLLRG